MVIRDLIEQRIKEAILVKESLLKDNEIIELIINIAKDIITSIKANGKVILAGNGGSCSDAMHIAGEFVSRFMFDRDALPAIALGTNNSILTAIGNDYGYDCVFVREFLALARPEDILIVLSTSGNSTNIIDLMEVANQKNVKVYGLTGGKGGLLKGYTRCIKVPSTITARIQEAHIMIGHIICELVESELFK